MSWSRRCCRAELRYFTSETLFHHSWFPLISLQTIFPPKALFRSLGERIPIPPCSWSWITCLHLKRLYFFFSFFPPFHRKCLMIASNLRWVLARAWRRVNWYKGRDERPHLRRTMHPTRLSHEEPHYCTFVFIFSIVIFHTSAFKEPTLIGMPR